MEQNMSAEHASVSAGRSVCEEPWQRSDEEIRSSKRARKKRKAVAKLQRVREAKAKKRPRSATGEPAGRPEPSEKPPDADEGLPVQSCDRNGDHEETKDVDGGKEREGEAHKASEAEGTRAAGDSLEFAGTKGMKRRKVEDPKKQRGSKKERRVPSSA
jgi:hypothetical protein